MRALNALKWAVSFRLRCSFTHPCAIRGGIPSHKLPPAIHAPVARFVNLPVGEEKNILVILGQRLARPTLDMPVRKANIHFNLRCLVLMVNQMSAHRPHSLLVKLHQQGGQLILFKLDNRARSTITDVTVMSAVVIRQQTAQRTSTTDAICKPGPNPPTRIPIPKAL